MAVSVPRARGTRATRCQTQMTRWFTRVRWSQHGFDSNLQSDLTEHSPSANPLIEFARDCAGLLMSTQGSMKLPGVAPSVPEADGQSQDWDSLPEGVMMVMLSQLGVLDLVAMQTVSKRTRSLVAVLESPAGHSVSVCSQRLSELHGVLSGSWRSSLFLSARDRARTPATRVHSTRRIDFSSFCVPDSQATAATFALVTDGYRLKMLDDNLTMVQGHIPPQFQQSPHRLYHQHHVPSPVPVGAVPDFTSMSLLLLQPTLHGAVHSEQWQLTPQLYGPFTGTWPAQTIMLPNVNLLHGAVADTLCTSCGCPPGAWRPHTPHDHPSTSTPRPTTTTNTTNLSTPGSSGVPPTSSITPLTPASGLAVVLPRPPMWESHGSRVVGGPSLVGRLTSGVVGTSRVCGDTGNARVISVSGHGQRRARQGAVASCGSAGGQKVSVEVGGAGGASNSARRQQYSPAAYDTQADLSFQLLSKALALQPPTYLDISHHSELRDNEITILLAKASKGLKHLMTPGTQAGPLCLMMLACNDRLNLVTLDLSHSLHIGAASALGHGSKHHSDTSTPAASTTYHATATQAPSRHRRNGSLVSNIINVTPGDSHWDVNRDTATATRSGVGMRGLSRSPPVGLVSGIAVMEEGLRHRRPSQLSSGTAGSVEGLSAEGSQEHSPGSRAMGGHAAAGVGGNATGSSLFIRLLRSALGRLTQLTELCLAGNDLTGLLDGVDALQQTTRTTTEQAPQQPPLLGETLLSALPPSPSSSFIKSSSESVLQTTTLTNNNQLPLLMTGGPSRATSIAEVQAGQQQQIENALLAALGRLRTLDISHTSGLILPSHFHLILEACSNLKVLRAHGCSIVSNNHTTDNNRFHNSHDSQHGLQHALTMTQCQLRQLTCGWGFNARLLRQVLSNSPCLTSLEVGLGASFGDTNLAEVAAACPHLARVKLQLSLVGDVGVHALLTHCPKLHVLHLEQCVGPFTPALLPANHQPPSPVNQHRWTLSDLVLSGPPVTLNDQDLRSLIGPRPNTLTTLALTNCPFLTPATLNYLATTHGRSLQHLRLEDCGGGKLPVYPHLPPSLQPSLQPAQPPQIIQASHAATTTLLPMYHTHAKPRASFARASLEDLGAQGVEEDQQDGAIPCTGHGSSLHTPETSSGQPPLQAWSESSTFTKLTTSAGSVTPPATPSINQGVSGQNLSSCEGAGLIPEALGSVHNGLLLSGSSSDVRNSNSSGNVARLLELRDRPAARVWRLTEADLLSLLTACPDMRSLKLRHCCPLSTSFVESATELCPLLEALTLDQCDLVERGLNITQQAYSPLQQVMVCRCKFIEPALVPQPIDWGEASSSSSSSAVDPSTSSSRGVLAGDPRSQRRVDGDVMVHDLLEGRTLVMGIKNRS